MKERIRLIRNVRLIDPSARRTDACDVCFALRDGKSEVLRIGKNLRVEKTDGMTVLNAHGQTASPFFTDLRCSIPDPGPDFDERSRRDLHSELYAACTGGWGRVLLMPGARPMCDSAASARVLKKNAEDAGACQTLLCAPLTKGAKGQTLCNFEELKNAGVAAVCADFEEKELGAGMTLEALRACAGLGLVFIASSDKKSVRGKGAVNDGRMASYLKVGGIDPLGELLALNEAITLARFTSCPLHFPLVSLKESVDAVRKAKSEGVRITCGVSPHYFTFTEDELLFSGSSAKFDPPLRSERDRLAVIEGLKDGTIDCICSDHMPCRPEDKKKKLSEAPFGAAGLETAFAAGVTGLVLPGHLTLYELLALLSVKPAGIVGKEASFGVGSTMDLAFFDAEEEMIYGRNTLFSRGVNTPFFGRALRGRVKALYINGVKVI